MNFPSNFSASANVVVYSLHTSQPAWIGIAPSAHLMQFLDARRHPYGRALFEVPQLLRLELHGLFIDPAAARVAVSQLQSEMPSAMINSDLQAPRLRGRRVQRNDGVVYPSANAAARANGVIANNLIRHLNRHPSYNSVGGFTYNWLNE